MRRKTNNSGERGFAIIIVVLIVAIITLVGASMLDILKTDLLVVGNQLGATSAREASDGVLMEILDSSDFARTLPLVSTTPSELYKTFTFPVGFTSQFVSAAADYNAVIHMRRVAGVVGSSQGYLQNMVYEVTVTAKSRDATNDVSAEVFLQVAKQPGVLWQLVHDY